MTGNGKIAERVTACAGPLIEDLGFELVDVVFLAERGRWVLRIYVDAEGGITLDDCALVSRELGVLMDVEDLIPHEYVLEVSSPGLNRPLRKARDFAAAVGRKVKVRLRRPVEGRRNFTGVLKNAGNDIVTLQMESGSVALTLSEIERANVVYEF